VSIPDFQSVMLPLLIHLGDGKEHSNQETLKSLAEDFQLSDEELAQLLPSGLQAVFTNRIAWAKSHLKAAPPHAPGEFITRCVEANPAT